MSGGITSVGASSRAARHFASTVILVYGRPGSTFSLFLRNTSFFIAFRYVVRLAFLFVGIL
jgi:hypothetical protein